jgi:hypothetical protein
LQIAQLVRSALPAGDDVIGVLRGCRVAENADGIAAQHLGA